MARQFANVREARDESRAARHAFRVARMSNDAGGMKAANARNLRALQFVRTGH